MKKIFTVISFLIFAISWSQSPEKISYQTVIRDNANQLLMNQSVGIQISILQGSISGVSVYSETHNPTSNANGLVTFEIGNGTTSDNFSNIDWSNGPYFIKTEIDPLGGNSYTIIGTSQFLSVPYALYAKTSGNGQGPAGADGVGIISTVNNGNGTYTFNYSDGSSFTTANLTGPSGNGFTNGTQPGEIKYWDGTNWISLPPSTNNNYYLTFCSGQPMWTNGYCPAEVNALNCGSASTTSSVYAMVNTTGVNVLLPYTGGNGGPYSGQTITSTGVTGLTATLNNGTVVNGNGNLTLALTGIPSGTGTANFSISFGGQTCTFSISVQALTIGTSFGGGVVAYILQSGDPGYSASEMHGLIVANADLLNTYSWGCSGIVAGGTSSNLGTGAANTSIITNTCGAGTAAQSCDGQTINGYTDWYLPSTNELLAIYPNAGLIGGFIAQRYWSSSEQNSTSARSVDFATGIINSTNGKGNAFQVRAMRSF